MTDILAKILYVEDDMSIAEVALMTLEGIGGFEVLHCASGQAALDEVSDFAPQLIILDVMMPGMDGPETLLNLRKIPGVESIPVIFMTAKAQTHEQQAYLELGALGVIVKPFDPMTLSDEIRRMWAAAT